MFQGGLCDWSVCTLLFVVMTWRVSTMATKRDSLQIYTIEYVFPFLPIVGNSPVFALDGTIRHVIAVLGLWPHSQWHISVSRMFLMVWFMLCVYLCSGAFCLAALEKIEFCASRVRLYTLGINACRHGYIYMQENVIRCLYSPQTHVSVAQGCKEHSGLHTHIYRLYSDPQHWELLLPGGFFLFFFLIGPTSKVWLGLNSHLGVCMCIAIHSDWNPNALIQCKQMSLPISAPECMAVISLYVVVLCAAQK